MKCNHLCNKKSKVCHIYINNSIFYDDPKYNVLDVYNELRVSKCEKKNT